MYGGCGGKMGGGACLAPGVECYNVATVSIDQDAIVSQRAHLCTASHDFDDPGFALIAAPIQVEANAWVCAEAFIGPGVTVERGAVVGARSVVTRDVAEMVVVAGNPARRVGRRAESALSEANQ